MTPQTGRLIAKIFLGMSILMLLVFVAQDLTNAPRPSWHQDLGWLGFAFLSLSGIARRWARRQTMQQAS